MIQQPPTADLHLQRSSTSTQQELLDLLGKKNNRENSLIRFMIWRERVCAKQMFDKRFVQQQKTIIVLSDPGEQLLQASKSKISNEEINHVEKGLMWCFLLKKNKTQKKRIFERRVLTTIFVELHESAVKELRHLVRFLDETDWVFDESDPLQ
jgi:hypothetical protein